jgi:hypothetical protein
MNMASRIVGVSFYAGEFKDRDGSFGILVEQADAFTLYRLSPHEGTREAARWPMGDLPTRREDFPEALGKWMEIISLKEPIPVNCIPSYQEANALLRQYFTGYGEEF